MRIDNYLIDLIVANIRVEYCGTHNSDPNSPLLGRAAYFRLYHKDGTYISKVTTPVKVINPSIKTRDMLLKRELKRRIEAIQETCETDRYGQVHIYMIDPYSIRRVLDAIEGKYVHTKELPNGEYKSYIK